MKRQLRLVQWLALVLLGLGMVLATRPDLKDPAAVVSVTDPEHDVWRGVAIMVFVSWCSAGAGVMNEHLIKRSPDANEASTWLYIFGSAAAGLQLGVHGWGRLIRFEGFSTTVWLVVVCNALLGQSIAFLLRYADSIVKLYAVCAAMGFTAIISVIVFGTALGSQVVLGYIA